MRRSQHGTRWVQRRNRSRATCSRAAPTAPQAVLHLPFGGTRTSRGDCRQSPACGPAARLLCCAQGSEEPSARPALQRQHTATAVSPIGPTTVSSMEENQSSVSWKGPLKAMWSHSLPCTGTPTAPAALTAPRRPRGAAGMGQHRLSVTNPNPCPLSVKRLSSHRTDPLWTPSPYSPSDTERRSYHWDCSIPHSVI